MISKLATVTTRAAAILCLLLSAPALADWPSHEVSLSIAPNAEAIYVRLDGQGSPLTEAFGPNGNPADATVTITVIDQYGDPAAGIPAIELWLRCLDDGLSLCSEQIIADGPTDAAGQATWTLPLAAGGSVLGGQFRVHVEAHGYPAGFSLTVRSADINGDHLVNLTDVALFTQALATEDTRCDFNHDTLVNLSDIVKFTAAIGMTCP